MELSERTASGERRWTGARQPGRRRSDDQRALLESAERIAQIGSWEWVPETGEVRWSDNHFRLFGLEPDAITPTVEFVREMTHPDDREHLRREVERVRAGASYQHFEYRIVRTDGSVRLMRSTMADVDEEGRQDRILGTVQDITDERRAERQIAAHVAVSEALAQWESFDGGMELLLRKLADALDCVVGELWAVDGDRLMVRSFWRANSLENAEPFETPTRKARLRQGQGLPGRVWRKGVPVAVELADQPGFLRLDEAKAAGLRAALAFPVLAGDQALAVVALYSQGNAEPTEQMMRSLVGIGHELGHFLARHRGELGRPPLTPREVEVLQLAARGNSRPQIAKLLTITPATVKSHFEHVYAKLGVSDRAAAVGKAVRDGLIQ
jgi:PAS domain S-box-containing protein